jgi:nucleoside-diphosphate-sugar epimerase
VKTEILVTGALGFVGKVLCTSLELDGCELFKHSRNQGDIRDEKSFEKYVGKGIQHVYHLAAQSFVPDSWQRPAEYIDVNVNGTRNAIEFARREGASFTFVSSYLYAPDVPLPTPENAPLEPQNPYGLSKMLGEELCTHYARLFAMDVQIVRPFNVYGPGQPDHFILPRLRNVASGKDTQPLGNLDVWRDFIHVDDLVRLLLLMRELTGLEIFNAGSGKPVHLQQVALNVGVSPHLMTDIRRENEILSTSADMSKALSLNYQPTFDANVATLLKNDA